MNVRFGVGERAPTRLRYEYRAQPCPDLGAYLSLTRGRLEVSRWSLPPREPAANPGVCRHLEREGRLRKVVEAQSNAALPLGRCLAQLQDFTHSFPFKSKVDKVSVRRCASSRKRGHGRCVSRRASDHLQTNLNFLLSARTHAQAFGDTLF